MTDLRDIATMSDTEFMHWLNERKREQNEEFAKIFSKACEPQAPMSMDEFRKMIESQRFVPDRAPMFVTEQDLREFRAAYRKKQGG